MSRRRGWAIVVGVGAVAFLATQVGWVAGEELTVRRADGSPAAGTIVAVHYRGARFNLVDSLAYERAGRLVRADGNGHVALPGRLYHKAPLDGYLEPWIDLVYDAGSHVACEAGARATNVAGGCTVVAEGRELVLADLDEDPAAWERSLECLASFVAYELVYPALDGRKPRVAASKAEARALATAVHAEYQALLARHGDTPRRPPARDAYFASRPAAEQQEILARTAGDLAREPRWGGSLQRRWSRDLAQLDRAVAELP